MIGPASLYTHVMVRQSGQRRPVRVPRHVWATRPAALALPDVWGTLACECRECRECREGKT